MWTRVVGSMPSGVFTSVDEGTLAAYCQAVALHAQAGQEIEKTGPLTTGSTGQAVASPWVKIQAEQARLIATIGDRLGFNPAARARLQLEHKEETPDEFGGLIN